MPALAIPAFLLAFFAATPWSGFSSGAWLAGGTTEAAQEGSSTCRPGHFVVALDVGHYRDRPGAISARGITEFEFNQNLAHVVLIALNQAGFNHSFLIGEAGTPISLAERTALANRAGANLFISLHHDSVQPEYLSTWEVAGRVEHYSDLFHGFSIFYSDRNLHVHESRLFAAILAETLLNLGLTPSLHHAEQIPGEGRALVDARLGVYRFDELVVLKTTDMPAVLLEAGIIVNREEEQELRGARRQSLLAAAVVVSVERFCKIESK